ncbi:MAG TPA: hypothetical protein VGI99_15300 [Gemmataceae bacterium]
MVPLFSAILAITLSNQVPKEFFVGRLIIVGNIATPDGVILEVLQLYPAQKMTVAGLVGAEKRLRSLGIFRCNPWRGVGPGVRIVLYPDNTSEFYDISIKVEERPLNRYGFRTSRLLVQYLVFRVLSQSQLGGVLGVLLDD